MKRFLWCGKEVQIDLWELRGGKREGDCVSRCVCVVSFLIFINELTEVWKRENFQYDGIAMHPFYYT